MAKSDKLKSTCLAFCLCLLLAPGLWAYTLQGGTWGAGANVTFSFDYAGGYNTDSGVSTNLSGVLAAGWENEMRAAFNVWAAVANITFTEVADNGVDWNAAGAVGDIRITGHVFDGPFNVLAHGYYPPPNGLTAAGDMHFDIAENWFVGPGVPGGGQIDFFTVALHELGHALGLGHSAVSGSVMEPIYAYNATRTLSADDIAGIQAIYGANSGAGGGGAGTPEPSSVITLVIALVCLAGFHPVAKFRPSREKTHAHTSGEAKRRGQFIDF